MTEDEVRIAELEQRILLLENRQRLNDEADDALERALRDRLPLEAAMASLMPILREYAGATGVLVHTYDESLVMRDFTYGTLPQERKPITEAAAERHWRTALADGSTVVVEPFDVAGESFGYGALVFDKALDPIASREARLLIHTWAEQLDNYLAAIARSRKKHFVTKRLSEALRDPVLDTGIDGALEAIRAEVSFDDLLLVFRHDEDAHGTSLRYKIIQNGRLTHDSRAPASEVDEFMRTQAPLMLSGGSRDLLERFGITRFREEVMIHGVRDARVVGKLVVTSARGEFNAYDRELLEVFADFLRQRVVDFNKEWKGLSQSFPPAVVNRLLTEEGYAKKHLSPRVAEVAILYADISGFSRVSEQVLQKPELIGKLIDVWGGEVMRILWDTGGVFDKMVGDCIIAFFGPPYNEMSAKEACTRALRAAQKIRAFTRTLNDGKLIPELEGVTPPVGVATGINYCPLCVGFFGPDDDYTGFSSGMNNTARLQGVATRDEILCMDTVITALGEEGFSDELAAKVKNVGEPLRYRKWLPED